MLLTRALAGVVEITAGADQLGFMDVTLIRFIAGFIVAASVLSLDTKLKIDDLVGAISVHLVGGIWGTLAVGLVALQPKSASGLAALERMAAESNLFMSTC